MDHAFFIAASTGEQAVAYTFAEVISNYMSVFFVAFLISVLGTPLMGMIATRLGIVDRPDSARKLHVQPVAYLGGLALFFSWLGGVLLSLWITPHTAAQTANPGSAGVAFPIAIVLGAVTVTLVGLLDDVRSLRARYKLLGQMIAAGFLVAQGVGMRIVTGALGALGSLLQIEIASHVPSGVIAVAGALLVLLFILGGCNATNLIDGLDGLAGGVIAVVAMALTFIVINLSVGFYAGAAPYSVTGDPVRIVFCLAMLGAVTGFLPYNFKPANIFMGDAGSMLLGYLCVTMILLLGEKGDLLLVMAGLIVFTVPILDTALAIVRRVVRRLPLATADAFHLHHLLVRSGMGVQQAVIVIYLISIGFAALGCAMLFIRLRFVAAVFMVVFSFVAVMSFKAGQRLYYTEQRVRREEPEAAPARPARPPATLAPRPDIAVAASSRGSERVLVAGSE